MSKFGRRMIGEDTIVTIENFFSSFPFALVCGQPSSQPSSHSLATGLLVFRVHPAHQLRFAVRGTPDTEAIITWLAGCEQNKVGLVVKSGCIVSFISMHEV